MAVPISNVTRRVVYAASGTGPYAFTFEILAATDIEVYKGDTLLTLTTDYSVTINANGTGSVTLVLTAGTDNITIIGARAIERITDFTTGGDFFANSLNDELDSLTIFAQQNAEAVNRALQAPQTDPTTIDMTLPRKADRAGKYLAFDTDGNPAPGPTAVDIDTVVGLADEIAAVSAIDTEITTVAGIDSNVTTVAGIAGNVSTVAGISGNVTTVAGISANVTSVAGNATNINTVAGVSGNVTTVAGVAANVTTVAGIAADVTAVAGDATDIGTVAGIAADVSAVAAIDSDVTAVAGDATDIGTVAGLSTEVAALGPIAANITTVAGISANVTSVAGNASNINQVASDTVAINAASTNATNAANSATAAAASATAAAADAAAANAVSLGNEPIAPSIRPSLNLDFANVKALDPRITFTRTTTATYYGTETAKAEENLLLQSEDFTSAAYNLTNATRTANTETAPDGTMTADTLTDNATDAQHVVRQDVAIAINTTYVFSCFLKAGTNDYAILVVRDYVTGQRNFAAEFDLDAGTVNRTDVGTSGTLIDQSITSVGNGWYRCVIIGQIAAAGANTAIGIALSDGTSAFSNFGTVTYIGTGTTIYAWGAQLEQRSAVTAYTATTTQPITNYIPVLETAASGVARFDHNPTTGESLGLLVEEQRTNLLERSEEFDNAYWTKTNSSITANTIVAPSGELTGDKVVEDATTGSHLVNESFSFTSGTTYTATVYAKAAERTKCRLQVGGTASFDAVTWGVFDLSNGTLVSTNNSPTTSITPVGNGWYRLQVTKTATATATTQLQIGPTSSENVSYTGDGYSGIYLWGAQLEAGASPTSYIPTVAASVTRNADAATMTGTNFSSWFNNAEGTIYSEHYELTPSVNHQVYAITNGTTSQRLSLLITTTNLVDAQIVNGGTDTMGGAAPTVTTGNAKITFAYQTNNGGISYNGSSVTTDTAVVLPIGVTEINIANSVANNQNLNSTLRKLAYYPARLSNAQLTALTTV